MGTFSHGVPMLPFVPPALPPPVPALVERPSQTPAPRPTAKATFEQAAIALLRAYDAALPPPPAPPLPKADQAPYRWLRACTLAKAGHLPENPFPPGAAREEAAAFRHLLTLPPGEAAPLLPQLKVSEMGTWMGLWRWGRTLAAQGAWNPAQRRSWEDRLLTGKGLDLVQGYALRHALCFTLAEKDEARLGALRSMIPEDQEELYTLAQTLFGHLGHTLPIVRLWSLPGLRHEDHALGSLGGNRVWIAPFEGTLPRIPPGCTWIVPTAGGMADPTDATLDEVSELEAKPVITALEHGKASAWLAPSRADFERLGLVHFPIFLRFDAEGRLQEVRMGDAAPSNPGF